MSLKGRRRRSRLAEKEANPRVWAHLGWRGAGVGGGEAPPSCRALQTAERDVIEEAELLKWANGRAYPVSWSPRHSGRVQPDRLGPRRNQPWGTVDYSYRSK